MRWFFVQRDFKLIPIGERWLIGRFSISDLVSLLLVAIGVGLVVMS